MELEIYFQRLGIKKKHGVKDRKITMKKNGKTLKTDYPPALNSLHQSPTIFHFFKEKKHHISL